MPKIPWTEIEKVSPDTEVTLMATRLPLRQYWHIPGFLATSQRVRRQLAHSEGLVGYALEAQLARKAFWTVSAWTDADHLRRFHQADPHHAAAEGIRPRMEESTFVTWTGKAGDLPIPWDEAYRRIAERRDQE